MRRSLQLITILSLTLPCVAAATDFSKPGPFPVGVTTLPFEKTELPNGGPRPLPTVVWYPAVRGTGTAETLGLRDARVRRGPFPLLLYSHGACGSPTESTYLTKAIASRGFVVAAMPHPGHTKDDFPGCLSNVIETFTNRVPDVQFVLDGMLAANADATSPFAKHIDPDRVAMSGGSFGGFTALMVETKEPRVKSALVLVPGGTAVLGMQTIALPTMVIGSERDTVVGFPESQSAFAHLTGPRFLVELLGANHLSVFDDCFNENLNVSLCVPGDISQDDAHRLVLRYAVPFLLRYAKGARASARVLRRQVDGVVFQAEP